MTLTAVPGVEVGHWTHPEAPTGCTVIVFPEPNVAAVEVRGAAPGSRETALLAPGMRVAQIQALLFTGGSAFGLAAADGVVRELEQDGRGHPTPAGPVPIVPAAVIFDLMRTNPASRPGPEQGAAAYRAADGEPVQMGRVGAGAGATAAKWRGLEHAVWSGIGSMSVTHGEVTVGALVVLNPVGDVFSIDGRPLTGGDPVPGPPGIVVGPHQNTTLVAVATNAALDRPQLGRLAVRAHDAIGACIRPAHTQYDGDVCFAISCGDRVGQLDVVSELAFEAVARSIESAIGASGEPASDTLGSTAP